MAWIAVHEEVLGSKLRGLRKRLGCSDAEALGILTYMWLWARRNTDATGLLGNADKNDVADAMAPGVGERYDPKEIVAAIIDCRFIDEIDGQLYVHDWAKWQKYWYSYLEKREKDKFRKREERRGSPGEYKPDDEAGEDQPSPDLPEPEEGLPPQTKQETKYGPEFEEFWLAYPLKIEKGNAYKKYKARRKEGYSDIQLKTAAQNYASECFRKHTSKDYMKHPKTFLSDTLPFTDYLPKEIEQEDAGANPFAKWGE